MSQTIFFDLDGTLTDPADGIVRSIHYALERLDISAPEGDDLTWCIGPPLLESFEGIVGKELAPRALELYRERFSDIGWRENYVYPGIEEVLEHLSANGNDLYVATSKPQVFAVRIIGHFGLDRYFSRVFGSELDGTRAKKADLLRHALAEVKPAGRAVMIGDRKHDVIGAKANHMEVIGVSYGYGSVAELRGAGAQLIADAPAGLSEFLG